MQLHEPIYNFKIDECQKSIENSQFFELDPVTQKNAYNREKEKLVKAIIEYTFALDEAVNINYGEQIWDLAIRCLKYYDTSSGVPFLHYYNSALKKDRSRWIADDVRNEHTNGTGISADKYLMVRKYIKWADREFVSTHSDQFVCIVSEGLQISALEASQIIDIVEHGIQQQYVSNSDGEENDLIDTTIDLNVVEDSIENSESLYIKIDIIEQQFILLQERTKPLIKKLLTSKLFELILSNTEVCEFIKTKVFFDNEVYSKCCKLGREMTAKEIAEASGLLEASVSRSWKVFQERIKL